MDAIIDFLRKAWAATSSTDLVLLLIWYWLVKIYHAIKEQTKFLKENDFIDNIGEN